MAVYRWSHQKVPEKTDEGIPGDLNTRNKWVEEKRKITHGDVVPMVNQGNPRWYWPLGRVKEVFPGPDGRVRVVRVITGGKDY